MWYIRNESGVDSGQPEGPYDDHQLIELAKLEKVKPTSLVMNRAKTKGEWYDADKLPALHKLFEQLKTDKENPVSPPPLTINQGGPRQTAIVNYVPRRNPAVAFLLTLFFGPLGMLYSTVFGAIVCLGLGFIVIPIIALFTLGFGFFLYIPLFILSIVWAVQAC